MMPESSGWALSNKSSRFFVPRFLIELLREDPLSNQLYPHGFGYYLAATGHQMQRENHEDHLILYCTQGQGHVEVNGERHHVKPGSLVLLPAGVAHQYAASEEQPWSIYWVHFSGELSERFIAALELPQQEYSFPIGIHPKLIADFETLLEARQSGYSIKPFIHASNQLRQLLSYLAILIPKIKLQQRNAFDLDVVMALMMENLHGTLDLDTLASSVNLSKFHFSKLYKSLTGNSPVQHFIHLKMEHACYLLDVTDKSISDIANTLDYEDTHYFSRLFKKVIGVSPKQYRQLRLR